MLPFTINFSKVNPDVLQKLITAAVAVIGLILSIFNYYKQREKRKISLFLHLQKIDASWNKYEVIVVNDGNKSTFVRQVYFTFRDILNSRRLRLKPIINAEGSEVCFLKPGEAKHYVFTHSAMLHSPNGVVAILHNDQIVKAPYDENIPLKKRVVALIYFLCRQRIQGKQFSRYGMKAEVELTGEEIFIYGGGIRCRFDATGAIKEPERRTPTGLRLKIHRLWQRSRFYKLKPDVSVAFRVTNEEEARAATVLQEHLPEVFAYSDASIAVFYGEKRYGPYLYWKPRPCSLWTSFPSKLAEFCKDVGLFKNESLL